MSRSSAFISSSVSRRLARTAPWQAMVASSSCWARCDDAAGVVAAPARPARRAPARPRRRRPARPAARAPPACRRDSGAMSRPSARSVVGAGPRRWRSRRRGGEGDRDQQRLRCDARLRAEAGLQPLVDDALVRGVHVDDHQALRVLGQDVDAAELRERAAERPVVAGRRRRRRGAARGAVAARRRPRQRAAAGSRREQRACGQRRRARLPSRPRRRPRREPGRRRARGRGARAGATSRRRVRPAAAPARRARQRQRVLDRMPHRLVHLARVAEAHLDLGRVHVHVDPRRRRCRGTARRPAGAAPCSTSS